MSSTKTLATRQIIVRFMVVVVALAVLAAGCSQSEDGASEGSEPAASTSHAGLSSAAPSSPAAESTTTTQASVEEELPTSSSEIATTTTSLSPAVVESSLSDEAIRLIDVGVDACGDLLELECAGAVKDICFQLRSDLSIQQSVRKSGHDVILSEDEQSDICGMYGTVHSWEVDAVLSAKYGEEYYRWNPGFLAFRDEFSPGGISFLLSRPELFPREEYYEEHLSDSYSSLEDIGSFDEFVDGSSWGEYLPDAVRLKLLRIFYDFGLALQSGANNFSAKSEDIASRILSVPDFPEAHRGCYESGIDGSIKVSLAEMLTSEPTKRSTVDLEVFVCIDNLCANREAGDAVVCYFEDSDRDEFSNGRSILRGRSATMSDFLWNAIKYYCAKGATDDNTFPNDICHRVAAKICQIISKLALSKAGGPAADYSNLRISFRVERSACGLGSAWHYQAFNSARARCYSEFENLLTTMDLLSAQNSSCNDASEECTEFWQNRNYVRIYYPGDVCSFFRQYYAFEIFWQKIPLICSKNNNSPSAFADSECYNSIRRFCDSRYGRADFALDSVGDFSIYHISPIRDGTEIQGVLCRIILDIRRRSSVGSNSGHRYLNLTPYESRKIPINDIDFGSPSVGTNGVELTVQLTDENIDNINSAVKECTDNSLAPSEPKCVIALWKSCFDLLSYKTSSKKAYFDAYYTVYYNSDYSVYYNSVNDDARPVLRGLEYVCNAAWIAELARIALLLLSSFPEDFQAGRFNQFLQYIADEAVGKYASEGILTIDENGTAQPNINREDLGPEVAESLTALGTSIAQLVQPYLNLPNANKQINI